MTVDQGRALEADQPAAGHRRRAASPEGELGDQPRQRELVGPRLRQRGHVLAQGPHACGDQGRGGGDVRGLEPDDGDVGGARSGHPG
jgi:hypothetical protein